MTELCKVEIIGRKLFESLVCQIKICVFKEKKCICLCTLPLKKKTN